MHAQRLRPQDLGGHIIDGHSHAGVALCKYAEGAFPYAQTIEGLFGQQLQGGIDLNVVFPFTADLYFDLPAMVEGRYRKARRPLSESPYTIENQLLLREIFEYCPEVSHRFLPFLSADPAREARRQVRQLTQMADRYPVYGIKINPAICQSPVKALLGAGRPIMDFIRERQLPVLLHTSSLCADAFSYAGDAFKVIEAFPDVRFCLAHCILFSRSFLDRALAAPNVWVDTAAFVIQVALCRDLTGRQVSRADLIDADFMDVDAVFGVLCEQYGQRLIWGSDSPAFSYICRRKLNATEWQHFRYKAVYLDEVERLRRCSEDMQRRIANSNTLGFLFGLP